MPEFIREPMRGMPPIVTETLRKQRQAQMRIRAERRALAQHLKAQARANNVPEPEPAIRIRRGQNKVPTQLREQLLVLFTFLSPKERHKLTGKIAELLGTTKARVRQFIYDCEHNVAVSTSLTKLSDMANVFGYELRLVPQNQSVVDTLVARCPSFARTPEQNFMLFSAMPGDKPCPAFLVKAPKNTVIRSPSLPESLDAAWRAALSPPFSPAITLSLAPATRASVWSPQATT